MPPPQIKFPSFEDIPISTNTIIGTTNFNIDMLKAYDIIPCIEYSSVDVCNARKRKKKCDICLDNYKNGDIISVDYGNMHKGAPTRHSLRNKKTFFRNAISVVMKVSNKKVNFKITSSKLYKKVKFQITGCRAIQHAVDAIMLWHDKIKDHGLIEPDNNDDIVIIFTTVMVNLNIDFGMEINRESFGKYINDYTDYMSLLETSFGYTGLNIKVPISHELLNSIRPIRIRYNFCDDKWSQDTVVYSDFISMLPHRDKEKWIQKDKKRYGSFLVFYSGKVIFSSFDYSLMKNDFTKFIKIISDCRDIITQI